MLSFQTIPKCEVANAVPANKVGASEAESVVLCVNFYVLRSAQVMLDLSGTRENSFQGLRKRRRWLPKWPKCERCNDFLGFDTKVLECARKVTLAEADLKPDP